MRGLVGVGCRLATNKEEGVTLCQHDAGSATRSSSRIIAFVVHVVKVHCKVKFQTLTNKEIGECILCLATIGMISQHNLTECKL